MKKQNILKMVDPAKIVFIGLCTSLLLSCASKTPQGDDTVSLVQQKLALNKDVVTRYMQMRWSSSVEAGTLLSPGYRLVRHEFENLHFNMMGSELVDLADPMLVALANRRDDIEVVMGEGDVVAVKYRIFANHAGNFYGIPASNEAVEMDAVAIFRLDQGLISEAWYLADEVSMLREIGERMPVRQDGLINVPSTNGISSDSGEPPLPGDEVLQNLLANPVDSRDYRNKIKVSARKANNPPPGIIPATGRPYGQILRYGFGHFVDIGTRRGTLPNNFVKSFPDRVDKVQQILQDGDWGLLNFRVTGTNTVGLFGLEPSNSAVDGWEVAFMQFNGEEWTTAWFFGDDMGLLLQLGGSQDFFFPEDFEFEDLNNPDY